MITAVLPATNHKPDWVEIKVDGHHVARIWAYDVNAHINTALGQFNVQVYGENGVTDAFVWVDAIKQADE